MSLRHLNAHPKLKSAFTILAFLERAQNQHLDSTSTTTQSNLVNYFIVNQRRWTVITTWVFNLIDSNGDGQITLQEYQAFETATGSNPAKGLTIFEAIDTNQDNIITLDEWVTFASMVQQIIISK